MALWTGRTPLHKTQLLIQLIVTLIHVILVQPPLVLHMDMQVELVVLGLQQQLFALVMSHPPGNVQGHLSCLVSDGDACFGLKQQFEALRFVVKAAVVKRRVPHYGLLFQAPAVLDKKINNM